VAILAETLFGCAGNAHELSFIEVTNSDFLNDILNWTNATSAATSLSAARFAAQVKVEYQIYGQKLSRALMIHLLDWTERKNV